MPAGEEPPAPDGRLSLGSSDLIDFLAEYLHAPGPKFILIAAPVGAGKSTLIRTLLPRLGGPKLFLAYQWPSASGAPGSTSGGAIPMVSMLLVDPQIVPTEDEVAAKPTTGQPLLAFSPQDSRGENAIAGPLSEAVARLAGAGQGSVIVDSWDRGTELFFRAQAPRPESVRTFSAPASDLAGMQSGIVSSASHLLLGITSELGAPLLSMADAVIELRAEEHPGGRLRVHEVTKIRDTRAPPARSLYTLDGQRFRSLPPLPSGFRPTVSLPDQDPDPSAESGWPGLASLEPVLGRLRFGGITGITVSSDSSDAIPLALAGPAAIHVLRSGGRVAWIPSPSVRPSRLIAALGGALPVDWLRERLRILSASGDDPGLGELRRILIPLTREVGEIRQDRVPPAPGVTPLFPETYRFLRDHPDSSTALYIVSIEGLRAAAQTAGVPITDATLPAIAGFYTRLPRFHLLSYGGIADPAARLLMPVADILLHLETIHGRPVLFGDRPKRLPMVLDWSGPDGRLNVLPLG